MLVDKSSLASRDPLGDRRMQIARVDCCRRRRDLRLRAYRHWARWPQQYANTAEPITLFDTRPRAKIVEQLIVDHNLALVGMVLGVGTAIKRATGQNILQPFGVAGGHAEQAATRDPDLHRQAEYTR